MRPNDLSDDRFYTNLDDRLGNDTTPMRGDVLKQQILDAFGDDDPDVMDGDYEIIEFSDAQR